MSSIAQPATASLAAVAAETGWPVADIAIRGVTFCRRNKRLADCGPDAIDQSPPPEWDEVDQRLPQTESEESIPAEWLFDLEQDLRLFRLLQNLAHEAERLLEAGLVTRAYADRYIRAADSKCWGLSDRADASQALALAHDPDATAERLAAAQGAEASAPPLSGRPLAGAPGSPSATQPSEELKDGAFGVPISEAQPKLKDGARDSDIAIYRDGMLAAALHLRARVVELRDQGGSRAGREAAAFERAAAELEALHAITARLPAAAGVRAA